MCLLPFRVVGLPQFDGAKFFMKEIKLTRGLFAKVDDEDFDYLNQWKWYSQRRHRGFYAVRKESLNKGRVNDRYIIKMHRVIMGVIDDPKIMVDHKDVDSLNNQKNNLRLCTNAQNGYNTRPNINSASKYKGVTTISRVNGGKRWRASCARKHLGSFYTEEQAAIAYNKAAKEMYGEFAWLNQIPS